VHCSDSTKSATSGHSPISADGTGGGIGCRHIRERNKQERWVGRAKRNPPNPARPHHDGFRCAQSTLRMPLELRPAEIGTLSDRPDIIRYAAAHDARVPLVGEPFLASVPLYHGSGTTPLLLARRIEVVAEEKLRHQQLSLSNVPLARGFADYSHTIRVTVGVSPGSWPTGLTNSERTRG
jgi:hypothetical protein